MKMGLCTKKALIQGSYHILETAELLEELKGKCEIDNADKTSKVRLIWKGKKWHALPSGLNWRDQHPAFFVVR